MITPYFLGFFAGGLSLLAPCVLPILPLIVTSSLKASKWGPVISALGLALSFTIFGILTSTFANIFDPDIIRNVGAVILILVGLVFIFPKLKNLLSSLMQKSSDAGMKLQSKVGPTSLKSEFLSGALLGMIWSPCTGPTLALAVGLASQSQNLFHSSMIFLFFGLGAGLGLVCLGFLVNKFSFIRDRLLKAGAVLNIVAGGLSLAIGILILTGLEGEVEEFALNILPDWLIQLSTTF